jgi:hypothetical protein
MDASGTRLALDRWGTFVLMPTDDGGTRFIIRSRFSQPPCPAWASALEVMTFELPHFIMERRMMPGIKALAERHGDLQASAQSRQGEGR